MKLFLGAGQNSPKLTGLLATWSSPLGGRLETGDASACPGPGKEGLAG